MQPSVSRTIALPRPGATHTTGLAFAAVLLAATWIAATRGGVSPIEAAAFRWGNSLHDGGWYVLWPIMQTGNLVAPVIVASATVLTLRRWRPSVEVLAAAYGGWAVAQLVKDTVARGRPGVYLADVLLREPAHGLGFVSGHVAVATAMATALWPRLSLAWRVVAVAVVTSVALGRVVAGAHLPLDVVGGAAAGAIVGLVVQVVGRRTTTSLPPA